MRPFSLRSMTAGLIALLTATVLIGCRRTEQPTAQKPAGAAVRATRRAYAGAPPVIPHGPLKASCVTCHTESGDQIAGLGFAPANPHIGTRYAGATQNCRQCHLFRNSDALFAESSFSGLRHEERRGSRAGPGAPPRIPHQKLMRENCRACHTGPSARPEIRCTHPERTNCRQCHLFETTSELWTAAVPGSP